MSSKDLEASVTALEAHAVRLCSLLEYAPRAFVMEFAGSPKSGKSTSVEAIRHFFSRHGFRVYVLSERAQLCPIPMKGHLFFNTWCVASMLSELLANAEAEVDIVIIDRGLFDGLVWLALQEKRGELTEDEAKTIESFLLLQRWRRLIDMAIVMTVDPEEALEREEGQRITRKRGSIMTHDVLAALKDAVHEADERYGKYFGNVILRDTSGRNPRESNVELAENILPRLEEFLNPEILVVPKSKLQSLPLRDDGAFGEGAVGNLLDRISSYGRFMRRADAELDREHVQIIPCGVLKRDQRVFLFQRKETDPKYRLYGRTTIWQGCHVSCRTAPSTSELLEEALLERIAQSLFLSRRFPIEPLGYCWDRTDEQTSLHLGVIYQIEINNPHTESDLKKKEFRRQRGHGMIGEFDKIKALLEKQDELNLECWSKSILNNRALKP